MTISKVKNYLSNLTGHITFEYNGHSCGIDPLALNSFDMWYDNDEATVDSVDEVLYNKFFDGKSLTEIWNDVTELDF